MNKKQPITNFDSLVSFKNSQGTEARGTLVKPTRTTILMEVYNPYSVVQLSEVLNELQIRRGDEVVYNGRAVVNNLVNTGLMIIVSVTLVDAWKDLSLFSNDELQIADEAEKFLEEWGQSSDIRPDCQLLVSHIRSFLAELNRWLEHFEIVDASVPEHEKADKEKEVLQSLTPILLPKMQELLAAFEEHARRIPPEKAAQHRRFIQRDLHPLTLIAPFLHRTYTKPLGYAGDYEMVNMMLRDPHEGPTTYAKLINSLFLGVAPVVAHRNRIDILVEFLERLTQSEELEGRRPKILNVGCGPAIELQRFISENPLAGQCDITLLDFNEQTINETKAKLQSCVTASGNSPNLEFIHQSVHTLLKEAATGRGECEIQYDAVYCAGLFDYLSDKVCSRLMSLFHRQTKPGGTVLSSNVHRKNPAMHMMEYLMEWHLIYRDENDMLGLVPNSYQRSVYTDATEVNIFLEVAKDPKDGR